MRYKLFGKSGLRVSEICLGTMTFGTEWALGADYVTSKSVFEAYTNAGGNFVDTANRYAEGTSERWLGEFIASDRDHFVLATKYTLQDRMNDPNFSGDPNLTMARDIFCMVVGPPSVVRQGQVINTVSGESTEIVPAIAELLGFETAISGRFGMKPWTSCDLQAAFV